jgi:hypothetical protein
MKESRVVRGVSRIKPKDKILLIRRALIMSIPHGPKDQRGTKKKNEQLGDRLEDS